MGLETGYIPQGEKSWLATKKENWRFSRLQRQIGRLARANGVDHLIFEKRPSGQVEYDRERGELYYVDSNGQEQYAYDIGYWTIHKDQLRQAIREEGNSPAAELRKISLRTFVDNLRVPNDL